MKSINLIECMNFAWKKRNSLSSTEYKRQTFNLITHAFNGVYDAIDEFTGQEKFNKLFITFQHVFIYLMKCDDQFLQGEYDVYCDFCKWCKYNSLKVEEVNNLYKKLDTNIIIEDIRLILNHRNQIGDEKYNLLVLAFCCFSLLGDQSFDENEYYIIRCFLYSDIDVFPRNWETFKKEW